MDEPTVRARAQAVCDALAAGDVGRAAEDFSPELVRNLGEVLALMPLPANEVAIQSIERAGRATTSSSASLGRSTRS